MKRAILRAAAIITLATAISGCITQEVTVQTIKPWENHYYSVDDFKNATQNITLDAGESVWVISNDTLKRVIKNTKK